MNNKESLFIGIDVGGTNIKTGIINANGKILKRGFGYTLVHEGKVKVLERISSLTQELIDLCPADSIKGIGIGCAGVIDIRKGIVITSPNFPDWENVPLRDIVSQRFGIETILDNDANVVIFGEYLVGAARDVSSLIGLTLGTGVGGGIILDGNIWHGCEGMAGEIGHMTIIPDGNRCSCGNYGCLEAYVSATAIVNRTKACLSKVKGSSLLELAGIERISDLTAAYLYKAARAGDALAKKILTETGCYLGLALSNLINIFNPEMIVIGGGVINAWNLLYSPLMLEIKKRAFTRPVELVKIVPAKLGDDGGVIGAAGLVSRSLGFS